MSSNSPSIWEFARKKHQENLSETGESNLINESHILVCGSKDSGKSTLIQNFLERDEPPKPTIALDYCFARRAKQNNMAGVKDVASLSELGGCKSTVKLIDAAISKSSISNLVIVMVLDLSKPNDIWEIQHAILSQVKQRVSAVLNEEKKNNPDLEKVLMKKAWNRIGNVHTDKNMISPLLVPLVIVGSKYDMFQELASSKKEMVSKTLRFLTHYYGGMLQYFSTKAEGLSARTKAVITHVAFKTPLSKTVVLDSEKAVIVPFGADSLDQLGAPPVSTDRMMKGRGNSPYDLWKNAYESVFSPENNDKEDTQNDPGKDKTFADEIIDNARTQKDQELERYRKLSQRKAKELKLNAGIGNHKSSKKQK